MKPGKAPARPRGSGHNAAMAARLAIIPGGLAIAGLASACIARFLPGSRTEATTSGMLLFFILFAILIMSAFSARNIGRLWLWLGGVGLLMGVMLTLSILSGGRA
jgi:hypothetical protein